MVIGSLAEGNFAVNLSQIMVQSTSYRNVGMTERRENDEV
jgi:hypothetical protein